MVMTTEIEQIHCAYSKNVLASREMYMKHEMIVKPSTKNPDKILWL